MNTHSLGKYTLILCLVAIVAIMAYNLMNAPDTRTAGDRLGDAIDELGDRTPSEKLGDAVGDIGDDLKKSTD